jgi:hypothetical protein
MKECLSTISSHMNRNTASQEYDENVILRNASDTLHLHRRSSAAQLEGGGHFAA